MDGQKYKKEYQVAESYYKMQHHKDMTLRKSLFHLFNEILDT